MSSKELLSKESMFFYVNALRYRPRACSPGNMAVQTIPDAKVLCSQILHSAGAIFGSGTFALMIHLEMKENLELATVFGEFFPFSALYEDG